MNTGNAGGKLVVFEGTDGSGKRTQLDLLIAHFKKQNIPYATVDFPRYTESFFGKLAGQMLQGELGPIEQIPSQLAVLPFACDRWLVKGNLEVWLREGKIVVSNRYTPTSAVYHAAKLQAGKQMAFIDWVYRLEQEVIGLPSEDIVVFFDVPVSVSQELIDAREILEGKRKDMYEKNLAMLQGVQELYGSLRAKFSHWKSIECTHGGVMRTIEEIHKEVLGVLTQNKIL